MGLLDAFRPSRDMSTEDWKRIGRLEADVESLVLKWETYRDEIRRLVQRLEQRDRRRAKAEEGPQEAPESPETGDPVSERVKARRQGRALQIGG